MVPTPSSLVAVDDPATGQVVGRQLHDDPVLRQDADVVLPHLAADVCQDLVAVGEFHPEHGVREWLDYAALDLDGPIFFRHSLRYLTSGLLTGAELPIHDREGSCQPRLRTASTISWPGMTEWTLRAAGKCTRRSCHPANPPPALGRVAPTTGRFPPRCPIR